MLLCVQFDINYVIFTINRLDILSFISY